MFGSGLIGLFILVLACLVGIRAFAPVMAVGLFLFSLLLRKLTTGSSKTST